MITKVAILTFTLVGDAFQIFFLVPESAFLKAFKPPFAAIAPAMMIKNEYCGVVGEGV